MAIGEPRGGNQPPRPRTDAFLRGLGRVILSVFFRDIVVVGADRFPKEGPVIVVSNHLNSLIDGVLVTGVLPRIPRLLAASIVWDNAPLRPLLNAAGVIPVYRRQDVGEKNTRHQETFEATWDLLAAGGILALFPEGISHNEPRLLPIKSGAARIALEAEKQRGPIGVRIVPVGLFYEAKTVFRSRALIEIGDALDLGTEVASYVEGDNATRPRTIRHLTQRIDDCLASVTLNFDSWDEAQLVGRAADLWIRQETAPLTELHLADSFAMRRAFSNGYVWVKDNHPKQAEALRKTMVDYDRLLFALDLRDEQVGASFGGISGLGFLARSVFTLLLGTPLLVLGTILNWIPFQASRLIARGKDTDKVATWSIFSSLILFPVSWLIEAAGVGVLCGNLHGPKWGWIGFVTVLIAAPLAGRAALVIHDVRRRLFEEARAWWLLRTRKDLARSLAATRRIVLRDLREIVDVYDSETQ